MDRLTARLISSHKPQDIFELLEPTRSRVVRRQLFLGLNIAITGTYAYIDRKKKLPVTTLLRAIGYGTDKDILNIFGLCDEIKNERSVLKKSIGRKTAARLLRTWVEDFADEDTGELISIERHEVVLERDTILQEGDIDVILNSGARSVVLHKEGVNAGEYAIIYNTLRKDASNSEKEALEHIYRQLRGMEAPDEQTARDVIHSLFFSEKRYDFRTPSH